MKKVILMGFGNQGGKIIHAMECQGAQKIYVDNEYPEEKYGDGTYLKIDFDCEIGAWNPEDPIRQWLKQEPAKLLFEQLYKDKEYLIIANGIGGTQSLVCKEVIRYTQEHFQKMKICYVGTMPFRSETDFVVNYITRNMISFLRNGGFAYCVIENDVLFRELRDFEEAYEASHLYISHIAEETMKLLLSDDENNKELLWKNPIYYIEFEGEMDKVIKHSMVKNRLLPYDLLKGTGIIQIELNRKFESYYLYSVLKLHEQLENELGKIDYVYKEIMEEGSSDNIYNIKAIVCGKEGERYLRCRDIDVFYVF